MGEIVKIFDTTLRDGEQSPGFSMDIAEKFRMAQQLARLKVDVIEAGFPIASPGDFEAVRKIAAEVEGPVIAGLARASIVDIDRAWEAVRFAKRPRIHTFLATSDIHMKLKLRKSRDQVLEEAAEAVRHARRYTEDVEFSAEDATRSDPEFLVEVFSAVIESGATTINVPDTVGYAIPSDFGRLIALLKERVRGIEKAVISVHCHNDLGLAVANSLTAIEKGARQVECTINGIGERAGNASMEEIAMTLKVRQQRLGVDTNLATELLYPTSKLLTHITGIGVQPNKAIVGANAFAHEAGIHQDGLLKAEQTYAIMTPDQVGVSAHQYVLGKHSGRHAFRAKLKGMGYEPSDPEIDEAFVRFKELADKKKNIYDEDLEAILTRLAVQGPERYLLESVRFESGTRVTPKATVEVRIDGKKRKAVEKGDGPVDAVFKSIRKITRFKGVLAKFSINALTGGTDAVGEVVVALQERGRTVRGVGSHTDIVVASARAFIAALNRLEMFAATEKTEKGI